MRIAKTFQTILAMIVMVTLTACGGGGGGGGGTTSFKLTVAVTGSGAVTSQPAGINCGTTCEANFRTNVVVALTAAPAAGNIFSAWGGACSGATATCSVTMAQARSVTALFVQSTGQSRRLDVTVTGGGTVSSQPAGIDCGTACSANYADGTSVTLTATAASGQLFSGWGGACAGTTPTCTVGMTEARSVTSTFAPISGQAGWSDAIVLSAAGAFNARAAIDENGNALLVWLQLDDQGRDRVWSSRFTQATGWSAPISLESNAADTLELYLAMDPVSGKAMVLWKQLTTVGAYDLWARPFDPASGWGAVTTIDNTEGSLGEAALGVDAQGNAIAIWAQFDTPINQHLNLYSNRYVAASGWGTAQLVETHDGAASDPSLYVAPNGNAVAVWTGSNSRADIGIWTNQYTSGSGWGTAAGLVGVQQVGAFTLSRGRIAGDANGNAVLVYGQMDIAGGLTTNTIYAKRYQGSWQSANTPIAPSFNNGNVLSNPFVQMNAQGAAIALWAHFNDTRLSASLGSTSGTWGAPTVITSETRDLRGGIALDIDDQGQAFVAWDRASIQGTTDLWLAQYTGSWSEPTQQDTTDEIAERPSLAMNERGNAVLAWTQFNASAGTQIMVRRYTSGR